MEIIIFFSILIAVLAVLTSIILVRRIKKQIAEMTDALMDVKNGNGNRRILSATNELVAPLAYQINEIVVAYESRLFDCTADRKTHPPAYDEPFPRCSDAPYHSDRVSGCCT